MKRIAVVYGGYSSEWEVSVKSGKNILSSIDRAKYEVYEVLLRPNKWSVELDGNSIDIDKSNFSFRLNGNDVKFDKVLIMIHGNPGENGLLQAYFELLNIPFTGCSSLASTLSFDKYACKTYIKDTTVALPKDLFIRRRDKYSTKDIVSKLGLPLFVKPNSGGSSFGVTKVKSEDNLEQAIEHAFTEGDAVLIEEFIDGREMTCGVFESNGNPYALPVTEIVSDNEYFDYQAKYLGASKEICPAPISEELSSKIRTISQLIYSHIGAKGVIRMDYIVKGEEPYFLEINPIPGMTKGSLVPGQIKAAGIDMKEFITSLIEN